MKKFTLFLVLAFVGLGGLRQVLANELTGVGIEEVTSVSVGGEELRLKGTAVRNSARQSIYVGGLYLQNDAETVDEILQSEGPKRFVLYCQNSTIKPATLIRALNIGIIANNTEDELIVLQPMIEKFNQIWNTEIKEGDKVWIDFVPETGTVVTINGEQKGVIPGKEFYDAFLKTWLGDKPINPTMKKQLLGNN